MANKVRFVKSGSLNPTDFDGVNTPKEVLEKSGLTPSEYDVTINGEASSLDESLSDYDYVTASIKVKGA